MALRKWKYQTYSTYFRKSRKCDVNISWRGKKNNVKHPTVNEYILFFLMNDGSISTPAERFWKELQEFCVLNVNTYNILFLFF